MKLNESPYLTLLRDKNTSIADFRKAAERLCHCIAQQALSHVEKKRVAVETPMGPMEGHALKNATVLVPILRSGLAMLPPFFHYFEAATVGVLGLKRDEQTKQAHLYYSQMPTTSPEDDIIIIDPMLATGGTAIIATQAMIDLGHPEEKILFCGIICSKEGLATYRERFPKVHTIIAAEDPTLNTDKFIVPGLGDFGDRYFGTL